MLDKTTTRMQAVLVEQAVPVHKATDMVASVWRGIGLIIVGSGLLAGSFALVYFLVVKLSKEPGLTTGALVLGTAALGVYFLIAGGNAMSGQALDAAANSPIFGMVAKLIRVWKGRQTPPPTTPSP